MPRHLTAGQPAGLTLIITQNHIFARKKKKKTPQKNKKHHYTLTVCHRDYTKDLGLLDLDYSVVIKAINDYD